MGKLNQFKKKIKNFDGKLKEKTAKSNKIFILYHVIVTVLKTLYTK